MGQYRPEFQVGARGKDGGLQYAEINRRPTAEEIERAYAAAQAAGL
jgi:uncharacterized Fe-S radical SAM superfamily protein PflX